MPDIDRSIPIPIYYQLVTLIKHQIEAGVLQPGDRLPTEAEICEQYDISRNPVQRAMRELEAEGVIVRYARRGTFIRHAKTETIHLRVVIPDTRVPVPNAHWQWPLERAVERWSKRHPEAELVIDYDTIPLADLYNTLAYAIAEGSAPDISVLDTVWIAEFAQRRYLYALDEIDPDWASTYGKHFYAPSRIANSFSDTQYGISTNVDISVLWYRKDWFEAEHLTPPQTWDDLIQVCRHFAQPQVRQRYGMSEYPLNFVGGTRGGETTMHQLLPLFWSAGADILENQQINLDQPATYQTLEFLHSLVNTERVAPPTVTQHLWDGALNAFAHGQSALAFGGTYENVIIRSKAGWNRAMFMDRVGFVTPPTAPGGKQAILLGGMAYGIYRQSSQAEIALELLKIMLEPEILKPFSLQMEQSAALLSTDESIRPEENSLLNHTTPLLNLTRSRPSLPSYDQVSRQIQEMIEVVLNNELPIDQAIKRTAERISGITGYPVS